MNYRQAKRHYFAFGLNILSEIKLPELMETSLPIRGDVLIKFGELKEKWQSLSKDSSNFVVNEDVVMFKVSNTAIFCVNNGKEITVSSIQGADIEKIRLYLLGTCMGAILIQRKTIPLHGSAIVINGKAYAFVGESGAGKSTLATDLINRGYNLLSDDVIPVTFKNEQPYVVPSYPQQKLWEQSLNEFDMEIKNYQPLFERETKYAIPVNAHFQSYPIPLSGVFELVRVEQGAIKLNNIEKLHGIFTLQRHTYRNFLIKHLNLLDWHFKTVTKILSQIDLYQIYRSNDSFTAHQIGNLVIDLIEGGKSLEISR